MRHYNIPVFVPHEGCPFDCVFCNQRRITGSDTSMTADEISETVKKYLKSIPQNNRTVEIAFFGGSFTGISAEKQTDFLKTAYEFVKSGQVDGIRLSTRPDYISEEILNRLYSYGVKTVELGVQSMDDDVLKASGRGHSAEDVRKAAALIKKYPFSLGLQMMTGLPGDTYGKSVKTAEEIILQRPDFVRIYPTLVLKDTYLEKMFKTGKFKPQTIPETVGILKTVIPMFRENGIEVIRVALATTEEISEGGSVVAGPFHPAMRELAEGEIYFDKMCSTLDKDGDISGFYVNPKEISRAVGINKTNKLRIKEKYGKEIKIKPMESLKKGEISVWKE